jgi:hypothetical protein
LQVGCNISDLFREDLVTDEEAGVGLPLRDERCWVVLVGKMEGLD